MSVRVYCAIPDCSAETVLQTAVEVYGDSKPFEHEPNTLIADTPTTGWWVDVCEADIQIAFCPSHASEGKRLRQRRSNSAMARMLRNEAQVLLDCARHLEEEP